MKLIIGGSCQGRLNHALSPEDPTADAAFDNALLYGLQTLTRKHPSLTAAKVQRLDQASCGIPMQLK